jgi:bifunctional non-homologous end joining protein LigD
VSTPVSWDELGKKDLRKQFTVKSVPRRLKHLDADPWADYAKTRQSITPAMIKALK